MARRSGTLSTPITRPAPKVHRYAGAHLADRTETPYPDRPALGNVRVGDGLPGSRQHVGEVEEPLVRGSFGHFDRSEVGLGHAQVLGLPARDGAVDVGVSEEARPPAASQEVHGLGELTLIARVLALGVQLLVAEVAVPAGDVEGDHDAVAGLRCARHRSRPPRLYPSARAR